jgi:hypothetical protein
MLAISHFALYKGETIEIGVKDLPEIPIKITCNSQGISVILMGKIFSVQSIQVAAC